MESQGGSDSAAPVLCGYRPPTEPQSGVTVGVEQASPCHLPLPRKFGLCIECLQNLHHLPACLPAIGQPALQGTQGCPVRAPHANCSIASCYHVRSFILSRCASDVHLRGFSDWMERRKVLLAHTVPLTAFGSMGCRTR